MVDLVAVRRHPDRPPRDGAGEVTDDRCHPAGVPPGRRSRLSRAREPVAHQHEHLALGVVEELVDEVAADETGRAGDEVGHGSHPGVEGRRAVTATGRVRINQTLLLGNRPVKGPQSPRPPPNMISSQLGTEARPLFFFTWRRLGCCRLAASSPASCSAGFDGPRRPAPPPGRRVPRGPPEPRGSPTSRPGARRPAGPAGPAGRWPGCPSSPAPAGSRRGPRRSSRTARTDALRSTVGSSASESAPDDGAGSALTMPMASSPSGSSRSPGSPGSPGTAESRRPGPAVAAGVSGGSPTRRRASSSSGTT